MTCTEDGCGRPAKRGGLCWGHRKRKSRGQVVSTELTTRPASSLERLLEAAITYADAGEDEDFSRAMDNLRKAGAAYGKRHVGEAIRKALAARKERGEPVGRPRKISALEAREAVAKSGGIRGAARELGVSRETVRRALKEVSGPESLSF